MNDLRSAAGLALLLGLVSSSTMAAEEQLQTIDLDLARLYTP